ncbi:MAG: S1 RNA-binding domain-containing protein, partial [Pseudomonadota bacterium]
GTDGLLHVSEIFSESGRIDDVGEVLKEGDKIDVRVMSIDPSGKIKLSNKDVVEPGTGAVTSPSRSGGGGRGRPRGGDRGRGPSRDRRY